MKKIKYLILSLSIYLNPFIFSFGNPVEIINDSWKFILDEASIPADVNWDSQKAANIDLPHTWNNIDVTDDEPGYFRGVGWYQKTLTQDFLTEKKYFLNFAGANQVISVFLNQHFVGTHIGGYSSFSFEITSFLIQNYPNIIDVRVDNLHNENIPPLSGDFNFFGGIYRDVSIITKTDVFFSGDLYNGNGVYWQTPEVSEKSATLKLFGLVSNKSSRNLPVTIQHIIRNTESEIISRISDSIIMKAGETLSWQTKPETVFQPDLWSVEEPNLYSIESLIIDSKTGEIMDRTNNHLGFRWYKFDSEKGFFLNGKPFKIIGASRHQDYPGFGNALPKEIHREDVKALKELGLNFLRIAHYPQDQEVLNMCDQLGIMCSVEIPVVNRITESLEFTETSENMMKEMIWQNYNHPSLIIWSYMNEVMLQPRFEDDTIRQKEYFKNITILARKLESIATRLDPFRYTLIPNHSAFDLYNNYGLTKIPMLVGWNLYKGWYEPGFEPLDKFLDRHHAELPGKPVLITEYGAGNDPRLTSDFPERFDCTNEYAILYHNYYLSAVLKRPFVSGALIWNQNDFSSNQKTDATPYINNKGLYSFNREIKEPAFFYKSNLFREPFVKVFLPYNHVLTGIADSLDNCISSKSIHVYSNLDSVSLFINNNDGESKIVTNGRASFIVPFSNGLNSLKAIGYSNGKPVSYDFSEVDFSLIPNKFEEFNVNDFEIRISCGDNRFIYDPELEKIWLPDRKYSPGSWGYISGKRYELETRRGIKPGSDQPILNTTLDPLYQTQRINPIAYRFDTKRGEYQITLCFALLAGSSKYDALRKSAKSVAEENSSAAFDVIINDETVLRNFSPGLNGANVAIDKKFKIHSDGGIEIKFIPKQGNPIINAIILEKE